MILQALARYYDTLAIRGQAPVPGYQAQKCSYALNIDDSGQLIAVESLMEDVQRGKKTVRISRSIIAPEATVRSAGVRANFLYDNCDYVLGLVSKGNPKRTAECHDAFCALQHQVLDGCPSPAAKAVLAFLDSWTPDAAAEKIAPIIDDLTSGANLVFRHRGQFIHDDPQVQAAWLRHYDNQELGREMVCLISGQRLPVVKGHGKIKGVRDASSMGASIVAFNDYNASCSYGLDNYENSPISAKASFAFTTALNMLLSDNKHQCFLGDSTVVYWSEDASQDAQDLFAMMMDTDAQLKDADGDLNDLMQRLSRGETIGDIKPDVPFYVLALSPNAGRVSVRFFLRDSLGDIARHLMEHYERITIKHAEYERDNLSPWLLLRATVNLRGRDKNASPPLAGAFLRAILTGGRYPEELLGAVMARVRATQDDPDNRIYRVTYERAALIKAFLLRNTDKNREVLTVALNTESSCKPYVLGRMFSALEQIQLAANPSTNATIKDRFFASACATPGMVFPQLLRLSSAHMNKLEKGQAVYFGKMTGEIMDKLNVSDDPFPAQLTLEAQGLFFLGYYQQNQARFIKKEDE